MSAGTYILGAGVTGLAAAHASGLTTFEAESQPGGICSSYYMHVQGDRRMYAPPEDEEAYRFEIGGGHWIFGGDPQTLAMLDSLVPMESYTRRSSVFMPDRELLVPYPIQNHLRHLSEAEAAGALQEILDRASRSSSPRTMADWIDSNFGPTLGALFFHPFHELYTASLWTKIAPQDPYKSPLDRSAVLEGASHEIAPAGYNVTFRYPRTGLDGLVRMLAASSDVRYGKRVANVDTEERRVSFSDGSTVTYDTLVTTLPLNRFVELAKLDTHRRPDPYTSVLVINIGAEKGKDCPDDHWVYVSNSMAGFHRVGFYSNVDRSFVPASFRDRDDRVGIYVEKAFEGGRQPTAQAVRTLAEDTIAELRAWRWIGAVDVIDPTWIDVAYTWSWPDSTWAADAMALLEARSIRPVGRYARWIFQGIADSIRDGLEAGELVSATS